MEQQRNVIISLLAGFFGGGIVVLLAFSNPQIINKLLRHQELQLNTSLPAVGQPTSDSSAHEDRVITAVGTTNPAVVSIIITQDVPIIEQYYEDAPDPFKRFFGDNFLSPFNFQVPRLRQRGTEQREVGGGSGFIASADGLIITNRHVVADEDAAYTVFTNEGSKYDAHVVARDPVNDLAVLKIDATGLSYLQLADSDALRVGQTVIAIGNALSEFRNTVSVGVVSGLSRSITAGNEGGEPEQLEEVIQTDAAINPGNSGGPLINLDGRVVGVNVAVVLGSENIGFALPSNLVKSVVESVQTTGTIVRPYLGVRYMNVTPSLKEQNNLPVDYGALVIRGENSEELAVVPGSPADKADLQEGDLILEVDGVKIGSDHSLASIIRTKQPGDVLRLKVLHKGQVKEVTVTLEEIPQ